MGNQICVYSSFHAAPSFPHCYPPLSLSLSLPPWLISISFFSFVSFPVEGPLNCPSWLRCPRLVPAAETVGLGGEGVKRELCRKHNFQGRPAGGGGVAGDGGGLPSGELGSSNRGGRPLASLPSVPTGPSAAPGRWLAPWHLHSGEGDRSQTHKQRNQS